MPRKIQHRALALHDRVRALVREQATAMPTSGTTPVVQVMVRDIAALGRQTGAFGVPGITQIQVREVVKI